MQSKFSQGTILSFLKDVISGAITGKTDRLEIAPPVDTDERQVVGTIDNPIARRCLVLSWEIRQEVERVTKEHLQAHEKGQHDPAECAKVHDLVSVLGRRRDAVRELFWQYVYTQFPNLRGVDISVGPNWEIHVAMGANIAPKALFDDGHPAVTFVNDLERLLSGNDIGLDVSNIVHDKVAEGETVIGSIDDPTLRALRVLRKRILAAVLFLL